MSKVGCAELPDLLVTDMEKRFQSEPQAKQKSHILRNVCIVFNNFLGIVFDYSKND